MQSVRSILDRKGLEVFAVSEGATVLDAARVMNERRVGALVVTQGEHVVGIFTERDVLNRVVAARRDPGETRVADVMTTPVAVCGPDTSRDECRAVMREKRIRHLPVVDDDRLVGIISIGDILLNGEAESEETIRYLYEYMHGDWSLAGTH